MNQVRVGLPLLSSLFVLGIFVSAIPGCVEKPVAPGNGGSGVYTPMTLLNVSYDPTRELWKDLNNAFIPQFEKETGQKLMIDQSHGGSSSQARVIIDGLEADVATLSIWTDTDALRKQGLLKEKWEETFENRSLPYTSTVVFVVRKGNPKGIKDWSDVVKSGVSVITPNPKTSGGARWAYLAAWAWAEKAPATPPVSKENRAAGMAAAPGRRVSRN